MVVTSDWGKFGDRDIKMAKELLSHIKEIESFGKVEIFFNTHSGRVFLSDEVIRMWMMNGDKIEEWYTCPYCGHEGFLEDMDHEPEDEECTRYMEAIKEKAKEREGEDLGNKIRRAQDTAEIKEIVTASKNMIYRGEDTAEKGLYLLSEIIGVFPSNLYREIPELEKVFQKLKKGEVRTR